MSGINAGRPLDRGISGVTVALTSLPEFVTAVVLLLLFSAVLGWLPGTSTLTQGDRWRSEEHTSELQSLMRISYAVFCLKKKKIQRTPTMHQSQTTPTPSRDSKYKTTPDINKPANT